MLFNFQTVRKVVHGVGAIEKLGNEVRALKGSRVFIVTDKGLAQSPVLATFAALAILSAARYAGWRIHALGSELEIGRAHV